jgi:hypothetical protein
MLLRAIFRPEQVQQRRYTESRPISITSSGKWVTIAMAKSVLSESGSAHNGWVA